MRLPIPPAIDDANGPPASREQADRIAQHAFDCGTGGLLFGHRPNQYMDVTMSASDEIGALARAYSEAVLAKDPARLAKLYEDDIRVFDAWGRRAFDGLAAWRANLDEWLNSLSDDESVLVSFNDVQIFSREVMGCLHALVTYAALNRTGETVRSMQNRLSWVVIRSANGWTIVHEHTSVPIGPDLRGILQPE